MTPQTPTPTDAEGEGELRRDVSAAVSIAVNRQMSDEGYIEANDHLKIAPDATEAIMQLHEADKAKAVLQAQIAALKAFEPLQRNHDKCLDPMSCIGYQNAASDFDNEKELRIDELETTLKEMEQKL